MAPATLAEARRKVETVTVGIGYPDHWRDYSALEIRPGDAFGNAWRAQEFEYRHQLAKLGRPVDRGEWWLGAHTVNAVFLPLQNAMNFPAGILEPPFYDRNRRPRLQLRRDRLGDRPRDQPQLRQSRRRVRFRGAPAQLVDRRGQRPFPRPPARPWSASTMPIAPSPICTLNGELTLGEDLSDLAGLAAAYDAWRASLNGREAPVIGGLTGDQRFFLGYAQSRREHTREATMRNLIATDGHSLGRWRAETVRNLDAWYSAFNVRPGQRLYLAPADRVRVW